MYALALMTAFALFHSEAQAATWRYAPPTASHAQGRAFGEEVKQDVRQDVREEESGFKPAMPKEMRVQRRERAKSKSPYPAADRDTSER